MRIQLLPLLALLGLGFSPMPLARAMTVLPPTFDELVAESGVIVRGRVAATESFRTTARDGRPVIKTRVTWEIEDTYKGGPGATLTLVFLGGRIGAEALTVPGMPQFAVGNEDFLFVEPDREVICPLVAAGHGRYAVKTDPTTGRRFVARQNGAPLSALSAVAHSLEVASPSGAAASAVSPESFAAAIKASIQRRQEAARAK